MVENVNDVEMRVVFAKVLIAAANAVLVAQHLLKLGAHLTTTLARVQVHNLARRSSLEVGSTREKKGGDPMKSVLSASFVAMKRKVHGPFGQKRRSWLLWSREGST